MTTQPTARVSSPAALAAIVPHLVGFQPAPGAAVIIGTEGPAVRVTAHLRPELVGPEAFATAADTLERAGITTSIVLGYGDTLEHAGTVATAAADALEHAHPDVLAVAGGRVRSTLCHRADCCPPEGTEIPRDTAAEAEFVAAGRAVAPDRDALALEVEPAPWPNDRPALAARLADVAERDALIGTVCRLIDSGDYADARVTLDEITDAGRHSDDPADYARTITTAAMVAYLLGEGARANVYAEAVRALVPDHAVPSLLPLLETALAAGLDPAIMRHEFATI